MIKLTDIVREEVRKFLYEKAYEYGDLKSNSTGFLRSTKTSNDRQAAQLINIIENLAKRYNSHTLQRFIVNNVFDFSVKIPTNNPLADF